MFPLEKMWFLIIVGQGAKLFPAFCGKKFRKLRQNCVPRVQKEHFVEKKVLEEVFLITCWQWTKNCRLFVKKSFSRVVETAFFASIGKFWGEFFERNVFFTFVYSGEKTSGFLAKIPTNLLKLRFFLSMRTFWGKLVFSGKYSYFLWILGDELLSVCWAKNDGVIKKLSSTSPNEYSEANHTFEDFLSFVSGQWAKKLLPLFWQFFGRVRQNCTLCVQKNILKRTIFFQK